jgi:hypothetical protein
VREELVPQPDALARAFDQPWDIGDHKLPFVRVDGAQHGLQGRERVVGNLRPRVRDAGEQRRLTRVRKPDQRRVGEQLQPQLVVGFLAREPGLGEARRLPRRRRETAVAPAALAAAREHGSRAGCREVGDQLLLLVENLRPHGHAQLDIRAGRPVPAVAASRAALAPLEPLLRPERRQVAQVGVCDQHDVAAGPAVAAVRPALGHVLLAPKAERSVPASPGLHVNAGPVVEHASVRDGDEAAIARGIACDAVWKVARLRRVTVQPATRSRRQQK